MKYLKLFENLNIQTTYYLSSSGVQRSDLPKDITSVLNLHLSSGSVGSFETSKDENCDIRDYEFKNIKIFDINNLQYENLKNNDLVIFHGGDIYDITNNIKKNNLQKKIVDCIQSTKYFVGISAGSVLLSKNSFLTKESSEIKHNHIHEDIAGIGIFDFGLNCHVDMLLQDEYFIDNFEKSLPLFRDDFYMIYDGSYIKVIKNKVEIFGNVLGPKTESMDKYKDDLMENIMEDLEDYLQEIFDKYNIVPWAEAATEKSAYYIGLNPNTFGSKDGEHYLEILNIPTRDIYQKIFSDITSAKGLIEKRLGLDIRIQNGSDLHMIRIFPILN